MASRVLREPSKAGTAVHGEKPFGLLSLLGQPVGVEMTLALLGDLELKSGGVILAA